MGMSFNSSREGSKQDGNNLGSAQESSFHTDIERSPPRRRSARLANRSLRNRPPAVIDLTNESDGEGSSATEAQDAAMHTRGEALEKFSQWCSEARERTLRERPRHRYLDELTQEEEEALKDITRGSPDTQRLAEVTSPTNSRIVLARGDFKLLRGRRWLNDELLNAYSFMINVRNDEVYRDLSDGERRDIPKTYMFSTFFYTCLTRGGYDFAGVSRWTKRAGVNVLDYDRLLFPVNLGNTHWILCVIDLSARHFHYLDSLHAPDSKEVVNTIRQWFGDEVAEKCGLEQAEALQLQNWTVVLNMYRIKRLGVLPDALEPRAFGTKRWAKIPRQTDSGSCGVYVAKAADCLALGIKMFYKQVDMALVRSRMALDLFQGFLPY